MYYRKKPIVIEAARFGGSTSEVSAIKRWMARVTLHYEEPEIKLRDFRRMEIETLEGTMTVDPGDYIIRGVKGEFYPCKPDIFESTYELVDEPTSS